MVEAARPSAVPITVGPAPRLAMSAIRTLSSSEASTLEPVAGYVGLLWWREWEGGYSARGFEGQRIVVIPEKRAVIITVCATTPKDYALDEIGDLISKVIRPALG